VIVVYLQAAQDVDVRVILQSSWSKMDGTSSTWPESVLMVGMVVLVMIILISSAFVYISEPYGIRQ